MTNRTNQYTGKWQPHEDDFLRAQYLAMKDAELAHALGRTETAVSSRLSKLRLLRCNIKPWDEASDDFLRQNLHTMNNPQLAQALGRTAIAICGRLNILGLRRPAKIREAMKASTRFQKGLVPWNKGKNGMRVSMATEFKKGHVSANTKYDGCVTVRVHKRTRTPYKYIRVAKMKWVLLHRYRWERKHGPIPPKHLVSFKNGDTMDCRLCNLRLISMAENAKRNWNAEKVRAALLRAWQEGRHFKKDRYIANLLCERDPEMKKRLLQQPELLEMKRTQLKLRRMLNETRAQTTI